MSEADRWILAAHARRELRRLDPPVQFAGSDDEWRLRVGGWRVRFTRSPDGQIQVLHILPRGRAYDR